MAKIDRVLNQRQRIAQANKENRRRARIGRSQRGTTKSRKAKSKGKHRKKKVIRTTNEPKRIRAKANTGQDIDINIVTKERRKGGGRKSFAERKNEEAKATGVRDPAQLRNAQRIASEMLGYTTQSKNPLALTQGRRGRFNVDGGVGGFSSVNPRIQVRGEDAGLRTGAQEVAVRNEPFLDTRTQQNIGGGNRLGTSYESPADRIERATSNLAFDLGRQRTRGRNVFDAVLTSEAPSLGSRDAGMRTLRVFKQKDKKDLLRPRQQTSGFHSETSSDVGGISADVRTPSFAPTPVVKTKPPPLPADIDLGGSSRFVDDTGFSFDGGGDELDTTSSFIPLDSPAKTKPDRKPQPYQRRGEQLLEKALKLKEKREAGRRSELNFDPDEEANALLRRAGIDPTPRQPARPPSPQRPTEASQRARAPTSGGGAGQLLARAREIQRQREELPLEARYSTRPSGAGELVDATPPSSPSDFETDDDDFPPSPPQDSSIASTPSSFEFDPELEGFDTPSSAGGFTTPQYAETPLPQSESPQQEEDVIRGLQIEPEIARLDMPQNMPPEGFIGRSDRLREPARTSPARTSPSGRLARRTDRRARHYPRSDSVIGERRFHPIKRRAGEKIKRPIPLRAGEEPELAGLNAGELEAFTNERSGAIPMRSAQFQSDEETQKLRTMVSRLQARDKRAFADKRRGATFSRRIPARKKPDDPPEPEPAPPQTEPVLAPQTQRRYGGQRGREVGVGAGRRSGAEVEAIMSKKQRLQQQNKDNKARLKTISPSFRGALNRFNVKGMTDIQLELAKLEEQLSDTDFIAGMTSPEVSEVQQLAEDIMRNNLEIRDLQNKLRKPRGK
jgi:hypothetical protein